MHFRETTSLTRAINTFKILSFFSGLDFSIHTTEKKKEKKKAFFFPPNLTCLSFAGNSRSASRCLQEGVKLYPLTSGTVSFWNFWIQSSNCLSRQGNDVMPARGEGGQTPKKKKKSRGHSERLIC